MENEDMTAGFVLADAAEAQLLSTQRAQHRAAMVPPEELHRRQAEREKEEREYEARQAEERTMSRRHTALHLAVTAMHHDNDPTLIAAAAEVFDAFLVGRPNAPTN